MNSQNKSYEELKHLKKQKINEWLEYLNSSDDTLLWKQKNRVFASGLPNILYSMKQKQNDDIVDKQYELLRIVGTYINQSNRDMVYDIVKQLKILDDGNYSNKLGNNMVTFLTNNNEESDNSTQDTIALIKTEYDDLKRNSENYLNMLNFYNYMNDFSIRINRVTNLPISHPNYYNNRIKIEIFNMEEYSIQIEGKEYRINYNVLNEIKELVNNNFNDLIKYSMSQNRQYFLHYSHKGEISNSLTIKYGQLIINLDGQVLGNINIFCENFINSVKDIIINANIIEVTSQEETINLLVERIKAMPNGTEFTISQLIDQEIESVIPITIDTLKKLKEFGITVKSKLDSNAITGLPQDVPYIKINNN